MMSKLAYLLAVAVLAQLLVLAGAAPAVGTASINAPAVLLNNNTGAITTVTLTVTHGNGNVSVTGPAQVAGSTSGSARLAVEAASSYLDMNLSRYNFTYDITNATNVSGPSAGTAMALLAVSALTGRPLLGGFTVTGTIQPDGSVGQIGGIYDKAGAASASGLSFMIVPAVPGDSFEGELYAIAQDSFSIPLVQVQNLSQAVKFAFNAENVQANRTVYQFYAPYNLSVPDASVSCTNNCSPGLFGRLPNFTLSMTSKQIAALPSGFSDSKAQMDGALSQAAAIGAKGYSYFGADLAFLDYIDAFLFAHHGASLNYTVALVRNESAYCGSLVAPSLTSANYEYVFGGELRQAWGRMTLTQELNATGSNSVDSDAISSIMNGIGEASAWCSSASYMYGIAASMGGSPVVPADLQGAANSSMARAQRSGGGLYLQTAQQAYSSGNYAVALLAADYSYALGSTTSLSDAQLLSRASAMAANSTFGIWATQFADESEFYAYQAGAEQNSTLKDSYANQAYTTALLAQQLGGAYEQIAGSLAVSYNQSVAIGAGQLVDISASWSGGTAPYAVQWRSGNSSSCQADTSVFERDSNLTARLDSTTVSPGATTYYCVAVTDSVGAEVANVSLYAQPRMMTVGNRTVAVTVSGIAGQNPQLQDTVEFLRVVAIIGIAAVAVAVVLAIQLYRLKNRIKRKRGYVRGRRRR